MAFYLTLPSNASTKTFPENTPGSYKVKLPKTIFLPENNWEVALASISIPDMAPIVESYEVKGKPSTRNPCSLLKSSITMVPKYPSSV